MELRVLQLSSYFLLLIPTPFELVSGNNPSSTWSEGICYQMTSQTGWKYVTYYETYKKRTWGIFKKTATRINARREPTIELVSKKVCCFGFHATQDAPLKCEPTCESGCSNGWCFTPNGCMCIADYRNAIIANVSHCVPYCNGNQDDHDGCGSHGRCVAPRRCQCNDGYTSPDVIYSPGSIIGLPCLPKCVPSCEKNAHCQAPNECECNAGYRSKSLDSPGKCIPVCDRACINGVCDAPNKCTCLPGYEKQGTDAHVCQPVCKDGCVNSVCTRPDHCECHRGYEKQSSDQPHVCSPICDPICVNANCIGPNNCECHAGHKKTSEYSPGFCAPICDRPCTNAECTRPNVCECLVQYEKRTDDPMGMCFPICNPPCINGTCTRPNHCECHNGHEKSSETLSHLCSPICDPPCVNADCIGPNQCRCHTGYAKTSGDPPQRCSPFCDPPCINAICDRPNSCKCHDGYRADSRYPAHLCSPFCEPPCGSNAFCEQPNKCACYVGYELASFADSSLTDRQPVSEIVDATAGFTGHVQTTSTNYSVTCQPVCRPECIENATCVAPNVCRCERGYRSISQSVNVTNPIQCHPICEGNCINGFCGYPNKCICLKGYRPNSKNAFECVPFCEHDCINGKCIRPDYCECNDGYRKVQLSPEETRNNMTILENMCVPICSEKCSHCIAPNQCLCDPGYVLDDTVTDSSSRFCQPLCEPSCPDGTECVEPNQCRFQSEYVKDQIDLMPDYESSTLIPNTVSSGDNCSDNADSFTENGTCVCKYGWHGRRCDDAYLCILTISLDNDTDKEMSIFRRVIALKNWTADSEYDELDLKRAAALNWQGPNCNEQCRISLFSSTEFGNFNDDMVYCHGYELSNDTDYHNSTEAPPFEAGTENKTILCFLRAESKCNALVPSILRLRSASYEIVGVTLLSTLIALLTIVMYFVCVRKRKNNVNGELSMNNSPIIEWSDSYECITEADNSSLHSLKQHILRHAGKNYKCGLPGCPTILRTENELRSHRALVHDSDNCDRNFQCDECPYAAKTKTQLRRHRTRHEIAKDDENSHRLDCPYSHCNFTTKNASHLKRHIRLHTGTKPYKCRHCAYTSNSLENLRKHVLSTSLHPGKTIYECDVCRNDDRPDPYCTNFAKELRAHLLEAHPRDFPRPSDASDHVAKIFENDRETASPTPDPSTIVEEPNNDRRIGLKS